MNKNLVIIIAAVSIIVSGCSKGSNSGNGPQNMQPTNAAVKIQISNGSGQSDTVGYQLANQVVAKVTQNGSPVGGYAVEFQGSGCNQDIISTVYTQSDGTASYTWRLASDVGQQTLKAYALNSQSQKVDSATATATGIATKSGWISSACTMQFGDVVTSFCKLSTGRIFAAYNGGRAYIRYSDDNGLSWYPVLGLGNTANFTWIMSSPTDELFAFAMNQPAYYSNDAGQTWTQLAATPFSNQLVLAGICTPSGKLIITTGSGVSVSTNKGRSWIQTPGSSFVAPNSSGDQDFGSPTEDQSGNLYVTGRESCTIYKSTDSGNTWTAQPKAAGEQDFGLYIDNNNWYYKIILNLPNGGIYLSKDNGVTYTALYSTALNAPFDVFSIQSDGNYYFENTTTGSYGLYESSGITSTIKLISTVSFNNPSSPYIVAKNGNIIVGVVTDQYTNNYIIDFLK